MASQALIYETAVPVTAARHGNWSLDLVNEFSASDFQFYYRNWMQ